MTNTIKGNDDNMTRYRQRTRRGIIIFLAHEGPSRLSDIAAALGHEERVIRNYLQYFREDFEVQGSGRTVRWATTRTLRKKNGGGFVEVI